MQDDKLGIDFIKRVAGCFGYCHDMRVNTPNIQVGGQDGSRGIIFWLHYDETEINKCSAILLREIGKSISINSLDDARELILDSMSVGFDKVNKSLSYIQGYRVSDILDLHDYECLYQALKNAITERNKKRAYFYSIQNVRMEGVLSVTNDMRLYGAGCINEVISDLSQMDGIRINETIIKDFTSEAFALHDYLNNNAGLLRVNAKSKEEALHMMDCFFGALCTVISNPFSINCCKVSQWLSSIENGSTKIEEAKINIPSVMKLIIDDKEKKRISKILSASTNKRLSSALSFIAHAWSTYERDRFINQVIALDALYGIDRENKSAIVRGVSRDASNISDVGRKVDLIYMFRNKFVHGEIPSLEKHPKYKLFIEEHGANPLAILNEIIRSCINNYNGLSKKPKLKQPEYII